MENGTPFMKKHLKYIYNIFIDVKKVLKYKSYIYIITRAFHHCKGFFNIWVHGPQSELPLQERQKDLLHIPPLNFTFIFLLVTILYMEKKENLNLKFQKID